MTEGKVWIGGRRDAAERLSNSDNTSPWWAEHRSRYRFAAGFVAGKTVLDVACGSGIGFAPLVEAGAGHVVGVDISTEALLDARRVGTRASVCAADGAALPVANGVIEVAVSFETIEHIRDEVAFVQELARVLAPDGTLLLSTPQAASVSGETAPRNPYHVREYSACQLERLLKRCFNRVEIRGQRVSSEYGPCPYWNRLESGRYSHNPRVLLWKVLARLPRQLRELLHQVFWQQPFYPREDQFVFDDVASTAHVLMAICREPKFHQ